LSELDGARQISTAQSVASVSEEVLVNVNVQSPYHWSPLYEHRLRQADVAAELRGQRLAQDRVGTR